MEFGSQNEQKKSIELFQNKVQCCGCGACENICPQEAIEMCEDEEGFLYPKINREKCINCHWCEKVCALKRDKVNQTYNGKIDSAPIALAVKHRDLTVRLNSRSGGIFTAITDDILREKGIVYGAVLTNPFEVKHLRAESVQQRDLMRGSKYVQSKIGDTFKNVKNDLENGRIVLFSGTSCQIAGLKQFLITDYENLICVDIVCHGVPSPLVWRKYLKWQEEKYGKCISVDFRNKKDFGWIDHVETMEFRKHGKIKKVNSRIYTEMFYGHTILRPACYECPYKSIRHPGDITIADFWGIEKAIPGFSDNKGVSLVLLNTTKGRKCFDRIKNILIYQETEISKCLQPPLVRPFAQPYNRAAFWKDLREKSFRYIANNYGKNGIKFKIKRLYHKIKKN